MRRTLCWGALASVAALLLTTAAPAQYRYARPPVRIQKRDIDQPVRPFEYDSGVFNQAFYSPYYKRDDSPYMDWDYEGTLDDFFTPYYDGVDDVADEIGLGIQRELYAPYYVGDVGDPYVDPDTPYDSYLHDRELYDWRAPYLYEYFEEPTNLRRFGRPFTPEVYDLPYRSEMRDEPLYMYELYDEPDYLYKWYSDPF